MQKVREQIKLQALNHEHKGAELYVSNMTPREIDLLLNYMRNEGNINKINIDTSDVRCINPLSIYFDYDNDQWVIQEQINYGFKCKHSDEDGDSSSADFCCCYVIRKTFLPNCDPTENLKVECTLVDGSV